MVYPVRKTVGGEMGNARYLEGNTEHTLEFPVSKGLQTRARQTYPYTDKHTRARTRTHTCRHRHPYHGDGSWTTRSLRPLRGKPALRHAQSKKSRGNHEKRRGKPRSDFQET